MLLDSLQKKIGEFPENIAIQFGNYQINYAKLNEIINKLANSLIQLGINKGDRIVILLPNLPHFVFSYYAILKVGAVVVPINTLWNEDEIKQCLQDIAPSAVIIWENLYKKYPTLCNEYKNVLVLGKNNNRWDYSLIELIAASSEEAPAVQISNEDTAMIVYSPGVVSEPVGIELTYENISAATTSSIQLFSTNETDRYAGVLPLFLPYSQNIIMNAALLQGATLVLYPKIDLEILTNVLFHDRITFLAASPKIYELMLELFPDQRDGFALKVAISIGSLCAKELITEFEDKFKIPISEGYGVVETSGVITYNRIFPHRKSGSLGLPVPGVDLKLVDDDGHDLSPNEIGEIVVSGKNVMKGYWKQDEKTKNVLKDHWYHTGDLGKIDEDGFLYFIDRKNDVIIKGGFHIYPSEIEIILKTNPKIDQVAVIGIQHPTHGQEVKACVVLKEGQQATAEEFIEFCKDKIPVYKCPQIIQFYNLLPRSATGKIVKRKLYEQT